MTAGNVGVWRRKVSSSSVSFVRYLLHSSYGPRTRKGWNPPALCDRLLLDMH